MYFCAYLGPYMVSTGNGGYRLQPGDCVTIKSQLNGNYNYSYAY